ncbi:hypothetical protein I6F37_04240 [Bradyrhizobium sp. NBAIM08]|nr:hypothetical protein [Bradyrhizobium sp. NBAIM08]
MTKELLHFGGQDASDEVGDVVAGVVDRAFLCDACAQLDLGEDLLDRVKVGRVRGMYHSLSPAF